MKKLLHASAAMATVLLTPLYTEVAFAQSEQETLKGARIEVDAEGNPVAVTPDEILVTGSRIRNAPITSPITNTLSRPRTPIWSCPPPFRSPALACAARSSVT